MDECKRRYNMKLWKEFINLFNYFPVAGLVSNKILCMHGGLSPDLQNYTQIPMPAIISKVLEEAGYKHDMPINFDELMNNPGAWVDRYINESNVSQKLEK